MIMRACRAVSLLALAAVVAACSFKTIYNRLDYIIPEYVEGIVTLDDVLEDKVEQRTLLLLDWHRSTQLMRYAEWMRKVQLNAGSSLTVELVEQRVDEAEILWRDLAARLNEEMAQLLPLLDAAQLKELLGNIEEKNAEFREAYIDLDEAERREQYRDRLVDSYENWIGDLTDEQEALALQAAGELVHTAEPRLIQRYHWQSGISEILAGSEAREIKTDRLRAFFAAFEAETDTPLKQRSSTNRRIITELTVQISRLMTEEQTDHFMDKTADYIRMFEELARE